MKTYEIVAAIVARKELELSWSEVGELFNQTKDAIRNRVNRFKDKYNVVDGDIVSGWNREFLVEHTPETEKNDLAKLSRLPGDIVTYSPTELPFVIISTKNRAVSRDADGEMVTEYWGEEYESQVDTKVVELPKAEVVYIEPIEPLQYLITPAVLVVVRDGKPLTIDKTHKNFERIQESLQNQCWQAALDFIDMKNTLTKYSNGRVKVENGAVTLDGERVAGKVVGRLVNALLEENLEALEAITNFLDKCDENPDFRIVNRIYDFVSHNDLRLDKDGFILAYKVVKHNYLDKYTGTMDNSPGKLVQMKRNKVNPNDAETCSQGLHVAAKGYISSYGIPSLSSGGDRVVLCKVNPKDFVSIPTDYNDMKARVCEYLVLKDVTELFLNDELRDGIQA